MIQKVAFLGLGVMGYPMAGHLANKLDGVVVQVYNRTKAKAGQWKDEYSGVVCDTPRDAANGADIVFACLGNDDDVRAVVYGDDGAFAGMAKGAVFVDHTTASADLARELYEHTNALGVGFIDAPVSGGQAGAQNGILSVMCGGDQAVFDRASDAMASYARTCKLLGPAGSGQLTKMVNQICIAGAVQGLSEAINFGKAAGLDMEAVLSVLSGGAAQSWQMENRGKTMNADQFDFGFAVDWMRKDLGICMQQARANGAALPVASLVDQFYGQIQNLGGGRWDTSSLIRLLQVSQKP